MTTHGSYFVMAHFHYTIMGGLVFALIGGVYYWAPKMTGFNLNERLGKIHFWTMFILFNTTFFPLFAAGLLGMPRRVSNYNAALHTLNVFVSISAFCLGLSMLVFLVNLVYSFVFKRERAEMNPWMSKGLEWQVPSPPPVYNFETIPLITGDSIWIRDARTRRRSPTCAPRGCLPAKAVPHEHANVPTGAA